MSSLEIGRRNKNNNGRAIKAFYHPPPLELNGPLNLFFNIRKWILSNIFLPLIFGLKFQNQLKDEDFADRQHYLACVLYTFLLNRIVRYVILSKIHYFFKGNIFFSSLNKCYFFLNGLPLTPFPLNGPAIKKIQLKKVLLLMAGPLRKK